jgi:hypothetical protein
MKIGIILLSIISMAGAWWWHARKSQPAYPLSFAQQLKIAGKSAVIGVGVYFCLMLVVLIYLALT